MKLTSPPSNTVFQISSTAEWPSVVFVSDASGPHQWHWTLAWDRWSRTGIERTPGNTWDAQSAITNLGGTLTVRAEAGQASATVTVLIHGTNPDADDVIAFLATKPDSGGFERILAQESGYRHFNAHGEPVKSFDHGYGMCQLTTPVPTFEQVWNWQQNVEGGLKLFADKRASARAFLSQANRAYTVDQLRYEAVCRWNGGAYHSWDAKTSSWVRRSDVQCDPKAGNIGWDMSRPENAGKTETALHQRDAASFSRPPGSGAAWRYFGVCYADHVLGSTPG